MQPGDALPILALLSCSLSFAMGWCIGKATRPVDCGFRVRR